MPEAFITAFDALVVQGGLTAGRRALVHAGASGVGTAAIQICSAIGAEVIVTASSGKVAACRELGADLAIAYDTDDFVGAVKEQTGGAGVDVVLDVIGGDYVAKNISCLAPTGRIIQVGVMGEGTATIPVGALLMKRAQLIGTRLRARRIDEKIAITRRVATEVLPLFDRGLLEPVIDSRMAFADVAAAHERMGANTNVGKIVLEI